MRGWSLGTRRDPIQVCTSLSTIHCTVTCWFADLLAATQTVALKYNSKPICSSVAQFKVRFMFACLKLNSFSLHARALTLVEIIWYMTVFMF